MSEAIEKELAPEELYEDEYNKAYFGEEDEEEDVDEESQEEEVESETDEVSEDKADDEVDAEEVDVADTDVGDTEADKPKMVKLKWNKKEVEVTEEERNAMAQQNFDYTYKTQQLAKEKKELEADREILQRVREGDKEALAMLAKQANVDPLDLMDIEVSEQVPGKPTGTFIAPQVKTLIEQVEQDPELLSAMADLETHLPSTVVTAMARDAETFYSVVNEVRSGDAGVVMPHLQARLATLSEMDRTVVMNDPRAYANFYMNVKQSLTQAKEPTPETKQAPKEEKDYASVGINSSTSGKQRGVDSKANSLTSDEAYQKILDRLNNQ